MGCSAWLSMAESAWLSQHVSSGLQSASIGPRSYAPATAASICTLRFTTARCEALVSMCHMQTWPLVTRQRLHIDVFDHVPPSRAF
jgi:hypothetical protein